MARRRRAGLIDVNSYMNVWYTRASMPDADAMLAEFNHARAWEARVRNIGHGSRSEMSSAEALEIATKATPLRP